MIDPVLLRALSVLSLLALVVAVGVLLRRREGRLHARTDGRAVRPDELHRLGIDLAGARTGAVLFGAPACAPCGQARRVLADLAAERPDFRWAYADAGQHVELVRRQRVLRVPTVLVLDPGGRVLARTSGVPRVDELRDVVDRGDLVA